MSLRWIHENLEPPNCDEECSDIDDSCSDDSYDSDLDLSDNGSNNSNNNYDNRNHNNRQNNNHANGQVIIKKDAAKQPTTTVTIDGNGKPHFETEDGEKATKPIQLTWNQSTNNPMYNQSLKLKLFCRTGYFVGITASGRAKSFPAESTNDAYVRLVVCPISPGIVRLQSIETGHFLAFNATGHLYGERQASKENTEWEQWSMGSYDAFRSHKYSEPGWWLGIKRNGRYKPGPKTAWGQKAVQFLAIRLA